MNISINGTVSSFFLACLVFWLFEKGIDLIVSDPVTNKLFKVVLFILCVVIALTTQIFIHS